MLRKSARISRMTFSSSTTRIRAVSYAGMYSDGSGVDSARAAATLAATALASGASRSLVLKSSPVSARAFAAREPGEFRRKSPPAEVKKILVQGGAYSQGEASSPLHFGLLRGDVLPFLFAFLGVFLLRVGLLFRRLPIVVLVLPLIFVVPDREVVSGLDALLLRELGLRELHLGLRRLLVCLGGLAGRFQPVSLLIQPIQLGRGDFDTQVGDLLSMLGRVCEVLVVRRVGRLLLGRGLLHLEVGLLFFVLGDVEIAIELVHLALGRSLLAAGDLDLVLSREDVLPLTGRDRIQRRVVDLVLEAAAAPDPECGAG